MKINVHRILISMLFGVCVYGAFAIYRGVRPIAHSLEHFHASAFAAACALALGNYVLRYLKWEFYLARLEIRGVKKLDSFLTFLSGFVLTITPGKVGEVFKSLILFETYGVPMAKTAPIIVAERATDVIGIVGLILYGASVGFSGGLVWAAIGAGLVVILLVIVGNESLATLLAPRNLLLPSLLSAGAWMLECLALWVILKGFGESTSVPLATFFYATSTLVGAIVPVPGGLGVTESALMGQMTTMGHVDGDTATAAMILVRFATLWFAVVVGFMALGLMKKRHPGLLAKNLTAAQAAKEEAA